MNFKSFRDYGQNEDHQGDAEAHAGGASQAGLQDHQTRKHTTMTLSKEVKGLCLKILKAEEEDMDNLTECSRLADKLKTKPDDIDYEVYGHLSAATDKHLKIARRQSRLLTKLRKATGLKGTKVWSVIAEVAAELQPEIRLAAKIKALAANPAGKPGDLNPAR
jgi:hypothetical protein